MTEKKKVIGLVGKGTAYLGSANSISKIITISIIFLTLNKLSVYEYGLIELATSAVALFGIFLLPGVTNTMVADVTLERSQGNLAKAKGLLWGFLKTQLILSCLAWFIIFFGADLLSRFYEPLHEHRITQLIQILSFSFLIAPFRGVLVIALRVYLQYKLQALYSFAEGLIRLLVLAACFYIFELGILGAVLAGVLSEVFAVMLFAVAGLRTIADMKTVDATREKLFSPLFFHGKWSVFSSYINSIGQNIRLWIIQRMLGTEYVGLFSMAMGIFQHSADLLPLGSVIGPIIPQYLHERARLFVLMQKAIKYQLLGSFLFIILGETVIAPSLLILFPKYAGALPLYSLLLLVLLPTSFGVVFTPTLFALRAQRSIFFAILLKNVYIGILSPLSIFLFGFYGVALEFFLTTSLYTLGRYFVLQKLLPGFAMSVSKMLRVDQDDSLIFQKVKESFIKK